MTTFNELQLSPEILKSLAGLGYDEATEVQAKVIPAILNQKDVLVQSKTGSGKTAAFGIPLCEQIEWEENKPQVLILTPTRELAVQVQEEIMHIGRFKRLKVAAVYGKAPFKDQARELKQKTHIVVGTPGRVLDHIERGTLNLQKIKCVVLDEADEMLKMGSAYCDLYPLVNRDLLYAGIILHDLGKLFEMSYEQCIKTEYTLEGLMIGHINMMVSMIDEASKELGYDGEEVLFLKHMVIAHHGKLEWGSPKEPMIIEAELLHYLDVVSAKMTAIEVALRHCEEGQMSDRIPMLDNRRFYHHK